MARPSTAGTTKRRADRCIAGAAAAVLAFGACARTHTPADDARVQGAAVRELFLAREHARRLVVWTDAAERGPTFDVLGYDDTPIDSAALATAAAMPVVHLRSADLARIFRAHPDGWAAFYVAYPGAPGLVEFTRPVWSGDTLASVVVGRACGEHCLNAWRVTVRDGRRVATTSLRVPKP